MEQDEQERDVCGEACNREGFSITMAGDHRVVLEESSYSQEVTFVGTLLHGNQSTGMASTDHSVGRGRAREEAVQGEDVQEEEDVQCIGLVLIIQQMLVSTYTNRATSLVFGGIFKPSRAASYRDSC
uniref:Uncharacterized protein n=1 Tax=Oryza glumipatula TaxID=40148 RepID=A0A0E0ATK8_9ORYZ